MTSRRTEGLCLAKVVDGYSLRRNYCSRKAGHGLASCFCKQHANQKTVMEQRSAILADGRRYRADVNAYERHIKGLEMKIRTLDTEKQGYIEYLEELRKKDEEAVRESEELLSQYAHLFNILPEKQQDGHE